MYKRLPPGPHHLPRSQVIRHQRIRIHGAIVEAVARSGYEQATVRQVVALAGVSRRSFYEQFANKEDCFLATFDLLAGRGMRRMGEAYRTAGDVLEDRLRAALGALADAATSHRKGALLVLVEAQTAGPAAQLRLRRATASCERLLSRSFIDSPRASPLPGPVVRALAGGLHASLSRQAHERGAVGSAELGEEMLRWTLLFQTPAAERMAQRVTERVVRRLRESPGAPPSRPGRAQGACRPGA